MIRFQRIGRTNAPAFRIVLLEKARAAKAGGITELLGTYNPKSKALTLNETRVKEWIAKGAQPTGSVHNLLVSKGVIEGKKRNVLPKKTSQKKEDVPAAAPVAEAAPVPTEAEVIAETVPAADESPAEVSVAEEAPTETPAA